MIGGHGGNIYDMARRLGCLTTDIIDMSSNMNPLGPPPGLLDYLADNILTAATQLPEVDSSEMTENFAAYLGVDALRLLAGNGTTQFIYSIPRVLETRKALIVGPTYSDYVDACNLSRVYSSVVTASESVDFRPDLGRIQKSLGDADTIFICNPNNPTGSLIPQSELRAFCRLHPQKRFIIDESYLPFVNDYDRVSLINSELENVIVLLSISKIFAIPGLRIGFVVTTAKIIEKFRQYLLPWSVNGFAHKAVNYLTTRKHLIHSFIHKTRKYIKVQRKEFDKVFGNINKIKFYPSSVPYILGRMPPWISADTVCAYLANDRILIRNCSNFTGLSDRFIRISLKGPKTNRMLAEKLVAQIENSADFNQHPQKKQTARA
ncbi:MAG: pyridoxal phosphate-dependent class II aminotransferase [Desulfobacterales bacterium]|jgi:threonine-phosphate decarboxylase